MVNWFPKKSGRNFDLPPLVQPFEPVQQDISFVQGLDTQRSRNAHAATGHFLTGILKEKGKNQGSCDVIASELMGRNTRIDYLTIGKTGRADGHGTLPSFTRDGKQAGAYRDLNQVYKLLFGEGASTKQVVERLSREKSSLDAVLEDAKRLSRQISADDRDRIDEYFTSIRSIEKRLAKATDYADTARPAAPFQLKALQSKKGRLDLVFDMLLIAMQSDSTRVLTYVLSTQDVINYHPHRMSHKASGAFVAGKLTHHQTRDLAFSKAVSKFLLKLKNTKEGDGNSLLYHSLVAYGTTLRQGHRFGNGPMVLAGNGGGGIEQGQNIMTKGLSISNVWLSMLRHVGYDIDEFGTSRGGKVIPKMGFS